METTTKQLLPIFSILRIFGRCPLIFQEKPKWLWSSVVSLMAWMRLILKISMAVCITSQEKIIASLIKDVELSEDNGMCRCELKSLYDTLINHPTEISLSDFVSLNNSLLLVVLG